jgi:hypothetical protein
MQKYKSTTSKVIPREKGNPPSEKVYHKVVGDSRTKASKDNQK